MAVGVIGLSLEETYSLTLSEFNEIYAEWNELETVRYRVRWEQTRFLGHCILAPYTGNKRITPQDLIRFDWDPEQEVCSKIDIERIKERYGD